MIKSLSKKQKRIIYSGSGLLILLIGLFLYGSSRVDRHLAQIPDRITITHFAVLNHASPDLTTFMIHISIDNHTLDRIGVSLSDIEITADDEPLGKMMWVTVASAVLSSGETETLQGQIMVHDNQYQNFKDKDDAVLFKFDGQGEAFDQWLWFKAAKNIKVSMEHRVFFD